MPITQTLNPNLNPKQSQIRQTRNSKQEHLVLGIYSLAFGMERRHQCNPEKGLQTQSSFEHSTLDAIVTSLQVIYYGEKAMPAPSKTKQKRGCHDR